MNQARDKYAMYLPPIWPQVISESAIIFEYRGEVEAFAQAWLILNCNWLFAVEGTDGLSGRDVGSRALMLMNLSPYFAQYFFAIKNSLGCEKLAGSTTLIVT